MSRPGTHPTAKQLGYAMMLLASRGYPVDYMSGAHKGLANMGERSGTVEAWLRGMNRAEISALITRLKTMPEKP